MVAYGLGLFNKKPNMIYYKNIVPTISQYLDAIKQATDQATPLNIFLDHVNYK